MNPLIVLAAIWGLVTGALVVLLLYRFRLESKEADWITMTEDAQEDKAIQEQQTMEKRVHKFDRPIQALGTLSVALLLTIAIWWVYHGLTIPRVLPQ